MQAIATEAVLAPPDPDGPGMFRCAAPGYVSALYEAAGLREVAEWDVGIELVTRSPVHWLSKVKPTWPLTSRSPCGVPHRIPTSLRSRSAAPTKTPRTKRHHPVHDGTAASMALSALNAFMQAGQGDAADSPGRSRPGQAFC